MDWPCRPFSRCVWGFVVGLATVACSDFVATATGQNLGAGGEPELSQNVELDQAANATRVQFERANQYLAAKQWDEAIETVRRLMESDGDKLVAAPDGKGRDTGFPRFVPVREFCQLWLAELSGKHAEALQLYRDRVDPLAEQLLKQEMQNRDAAALERIVEQLFVSSFGDEALLQLGEIRLERGDYVGARAAWQKISPLLVTPPGAEVGGIAAGRPLWLALRGLNLDQQWVQLQPLLTAPRRAATWLSYPDTNLNLADVRARLVLASIMEQTPERARLELEVLRRLHPDAQGQIGGRRGGLAELLTDLLRESERWPAPRLHADWPTFGGTNERQRIAAREPDIGGRSLWTVELPRLTATGGQAASGRPPAGETADGLLGYHPVIVGEHVFVAEPAGLRALRLRTGEPAWPGGDNADPAGLFYRATFAGDGAARRHVGAPRFTLSTWDQKLFARVGSPITGSALDDRKLRTERGYVVGVDIAAEGRATFKLDLAEPDFPADWALDGAPLCDGGQLFALLRRRDAVRVQSYVASFDLTSGKLRWRRFVAAAETPRRRAVSEITHNLLTLHAGVLYVNSNLGAVAAIGARDGQVRWLTRYPRSDYHVGDPDRADRYSYRDLTPCLVHQGQVFVAPADCNEIFSLDAATGQRLWSTDPDRATDAVHLLGVAAGNLIVSGDYLYWFDAYTGQPAGQFPPPRKEASGFSLASPRGYGRGLLVGENVWWPTHDKILVFKQQTERDTIVWSPVAVREIDLKQRGVTGGNLLIADGVLLIAGPDKLIAFDQQ